MNVNDSWFNSSVYLKFIVRRIKLSIHIVIIIATVHDQEILSTYIHDIKYDKVIV